MAPPLATLHTTDSTTFGTLLGSLPISPHSSLTLRTPQTQSQPQISSRAKHGQWIGRVRIGITATAWQHQMQASSRSIRRITFTSVLHRFPLTALLQPNKFHSRIQYGQLPFISNLPHPPHLAAAHLPICRRNRQYRTKLPLPLCTLPRPRGWLSRRLRRHVHIPGLGQPTRRTRSRHRDPHIRAA